MIASLIGMLNLLLVSAELAVLPGESAPVLAIVVAAAIVTTAAVVLLALPALSSSASPPAPRPIDPSAPLAQSDPDAAGHSRPRAPGAAASAA
ncbi:MULTISPECIES: DUF6412 domain-containing protein [Microbacterium]|uniref:DUF6412 domain-containing protein n=1 Tax=Microbacterium TaxID=33882 RepID=UPI0027825BFF|nr:MULTISPECIES: DUF6412 domain-containing protein [Microbacterium]MDQ1083676.1 hypothetical protein [Microbacterium sp. SORGH_AS_0344]MDQ1171047.1 hypothetical protein [Microbacterium proteolyticum]